MFKERAIRTIALRNVLWGDDPDFQLRLKFRFVSEHLLIPYDVLEQMPLDDVLRHYWEIYYQKQYEAYKEGDKNAEQAIAYDRKFLAMTPEALAQAQKAEDAKDASDARYLERARQQEEKEQAPKKPLVYELPEDTEIVFDFENSVLDSVSQQSSKKP